MSNNIKITQECPFTEFYETQYDEMKRYQTGMTTKEFNEHFSKSRSIMPDISEQLRCQKEHCADRCFDCDLFPSTFYEHMRRDIEGAKNVKQY